MNGSPKSREQRLHFENEDDIRFGETIEEGEDGDLILVGFPYDVGVQRNGGRVGAREGPQAFRRILRKVGTINNLEYGIDMSHLKVTDSGNIDPTLSLEEAHSQLRQRVSSLLMRSKIVFSIGGGNDQSYPNASGLLDCQEVLQFKKIGVINVDAHLDVRPPKNGRVHSGSPFRLLLESERFDPTNFVEFGTQGHQCSAAHVQYVRQKGGRIVWLQQLRNNKEKSVGMQFEEILESLPHPTFLSFDLDSIQGSDAPGVSAPGVVGITAQDALDICYIAGKSSKVILFDCSEYNPTVEEYRTGKLAATMFYFFALGVSQRDSIRSK